MYVRYRSKAYTGLLPQRAEFAEVIHPKANTSIDFAFALSHDLKKNLSSFTSDSSGQLNVLWHNGDSFSVNGTEIGVFEETDQLSLAGLL